MNFTKYGKKDWQADFIIRFFFIRFSDSFLRTGKTLLFFSFLEMFSSSIVLKINFSEEAIDFPHECIIQTYIILKINFSEEAIDYPHECIIQTYIISSMGFIEIKVFYY